MEEFRTIKYLKSQGMTITSFSKKTGVSPIFLSYILKKRRPASPRMVRLLIEATNGALDESDFIISSKGK